MRMLLGKRSSAAVLVQRHRARRIPPVPLRRRAPARPDQRGRYASRDRNGRGVQRGDDHLGWCLVSRRSRATWHDFALVIAVILICDMVLLTLRLWGWLLTTAALAGSAYYGARLHERRVTPARVRRAPAAQVAWPPQPVPVTSSPGDRAAPMPRVTRESLLADARSGAHDLRGLQ